MRILLVYPAIPPTYWNMRHALPFVGKQASLPPLGLVTVAAMLPEGCEARLVDMNVEPLTEEALTWADVVLTSSMLIQKESHAEVVRACKALGKPVVAGGPYPTSSHAEMDGVDHFVLGEAEEVLAGFFDDLAAGRARRVYGSERRPALEHTPVPRFDLLRPGAYASMAVQYSRGCPHRCEFCDVIELFGRVPRTKSAEQMLRELDALYATGYRGSVFVVDDNFIGNRREVMQVLPRIADWQRARGYPFPLFTETTVTLGSDERLMDAMVDAGFNSVFLGIETPVEASLREAHKTQNVKLDLLASVRALRRHGLEVAAGFIVGFDGDPDDVFERQLSFIQEAGIPQAMVGILTVLPSTQLHHRLAAEGRLVRPSVGDNTQLELTYVPRMPAQRLVEGYRGLMDELYSPRRYFERCLVSLGELRPHRTSSRAIGASELRALGRSLVVQGTSRYARAYWSFVARSLFSRPRMFAEAITLAVKGHHFFEMTAAIAPAGEPAREPARRRSWLGGGAATLARLGAAFARGRSAGSTPAAAPLVPPRLLAPERARAAGKG